MNQIDMKLEWMQLLITHEERMAEIYRLFSDFSSSYTNFWKEMVVDETRHVAWLRILNERLKNGKLEINVQRFPREAVQLSLNYINQQIELYKREGISSKKAFMIAVDIESALIERKFFEAFEGLDEEAKEIVVRIIEETEKHQKKVKEIKALLS